MPIVTIDEEKEGQKDQIIGVVVIVLLLGGLTWLVLKAASKKRK